MPIVSRHANAQLKAGARHPTLETAYSCETGYPFDDSRQIGNTSQFDKIPVSCVFNDSEGLYKTTACR